MGGKVLFAASTYSHIVNFHLPYLRKFREEGWTVHAACAGTPMPIPTVHRRSHQISNTLFVAVINIAMQSGSARLVGKHFTHQDFCAAGSRSASAAYSPQTMGKTSFRPYRATLSRACSASVRHSRSDSINRRICSAQTLSSP